MKITRLTTENVKRITAVTITPDGAVVKVGGKNGSGKTSALDSIAWALGGERLVPAEPIRQGETDAKITVEVGDDLIVTRTFRRERLCDCGQDGKQDIAVHAADCIAHTKFGETTSRLRVTNKVGASYPSPQAVLDKLVGSLAFDPMEFMREKPAKQAEILRRLAGLDFTQLDTDRKFAADKRAIAKRTLAILEAQQVAMPKHDGIGGEIPIKSALVQIDNAETARKVAEHDKRAVERASDMCETYQRRCEETQKNIADAEALLTKLRTSLTQFEASLAAARTDKDAKQATAAASIAAVPDVGELKTELSRIEEHNRKARENIKYAAMSADVAASLADIEREQTAVENFDKQKDFLLAAAKFPITGLAVNDDGPTLNNVPLVQASSAEQLRVSLAIGLALDPTLKVMIVRNGNMLDEDSMKLVAAQAETAGAQVWMEIVTASADGMTVLLEDGHVQ